MESERISMAQIPLGTLEGIIRTEKVNLPERQLLILISILIFMSIFIFVQKC